MVPVPLPQADWERADAQHAVSGSCYPLFLHLLKEVTSFWVETLTETEYLRARPPVPVAVSGAASVCARVPSAFVRLCELPWLAQALKMRHSPAPEGDGSLAHLRAPRHVQGLRTGGGGGSISISCCLCGGFSLLFDKAHHASVRPPREDGGTLDPPPPAKRARVMQHDAARHGCAGTEVT